VIAVLFDMDGTLLDLEVDIERVRSELGDLFGPRGYSARFAPIIVCIDEAARQVAADESERVELVRRGRALIDAAETRAAASARPRADVVETLRRLGAGNGTPFGLLTNNSRACVPVALESAGLAELGWQADAIVTRDEAPTKPVPDGVAAAARRLLPRGGALWYIGDSMLDVEAGRAARAVLEGAGSARIEVVTVAVCGGRHSVEELRAARPDHLLSTLRELWSLEPWRVR